MTELAQATIDDNPTAEFANKVFDTESEKSFEVSKTDHSPKVLQSMDAFIS
jgi:hypothetical protein